MDIRVLAALRTNLSPQAVLGKARLETLCLLTAGMIGARTVNLSFLAAGGPVTPWLHRLAGGCSAFSSMSHCPMTGLLRSSRRCWPHRPVVSLPGPHQLEDRAAR